MTVVTYGPDKEFPAFFTPKSGYQVCHVTLQMCHVTLQLCHVMYHHFLPPTQAPFNVETPLQCAKLIGMEQLIWSGLIAQSVILTSFPQGAWNDKFLESLYNHITCGYMYLCMSVQVYIHLCFRSICNSLGIQEIFW